ncbi:SDR family oxidoreductase [Gracilibacillus suaedae]|uniref:SDR family oxidoreductase n=1 Tax=Gracilibacillus suaedae TaxID=2820273 RepID=UPI001ABE2DBF|nr:SDR family oxidoreductase [Gracilibacillus suaedae]
MNKKQSVLLVGATGYLGSYILRQLLNQNYSVRVVVRNPQKLPQVDKEHYEVIEGEVTKPSTLKNCCENVDVVISTVGITRQKDGLTYMDVDYQANLNVLEEAIKRKVKKFIYVSVLHGDKMKNVKICVAKEKFVERLRHSSLDYTIIRPNGFFSDLTEFYQMAKRGRVYLFGNGQVKINPIHGEDLAKVCVGAIRKSEIEIKVGGPEVLTHRSIAFLAFMALNKKPKITYIPDWVRIASIKFVKTFISSKTYGPIEFFLTVMARDDMIAPKYGRHTLKTYFENVDL